MFKNIILNTIFIFFIFNILIFANTDDINNSQITIKAVGDITFGSLYPKPILPPNDGKNIFDNVKEYFKNCDLLIGNLEGTFTTVQECAKKNVDNIKSFAFKMPLHYVNYLKEENFTVLNIANNHSRDFGQDGLNETIITLKKSGLEYCGLKDSVTIIERKGIKIGVIGFYWTPFFNDICDIENSKKIIKNARKKVDILIVNFHGGAEGEKALHTKNKMEYFFNDKRGNVVKFAKEAINSGADFVFGHGPHLTRAIISYNDKIIAFSLGNFCSYCLFNLTPPRNLSLILEISLDKKGKFISGKIIPIVLKDEGIPFYDDKKEVIKLIKKLTSIDFPDNKIFISDEGDIKINK